MIVKGLTAEEVRAAIGIVGARNFGGNLTVNREPEQYRGGVRFTLRVESSKGPGHRLGYSLNKAGNQKRLTAACFHAYGEVIRELLARGAKYVQSAPIMLERSRNKDARPARWTWDNWQENADAMAYQNIGSIMEPLMFCEACECEEGPMPRHAETVYAASPDWKAPKGYENFRAARQEARG